MLKRDQIFTHRGLEPSKPDFFPESSYQAFEDQLSRAFGIEFDPNWVKDGIVVSHDSSLKRISQGRDERLFHDVTLADVISMEYGAQRRGRIGTLDEIMDLITPSASRMNALHLKGKFQDQSYLDSLLAVLTKHESISDRILIFDAKPETARYLKQHIASVHIAPSVAHPYDIARYNDAVLGTLLSLEDAIMYKKEGLYDWVWLDEWDLADEGGKTKSLYNKETFDTLRAAGYKISLVTPELHGTSPGLLGGESHPDAVSQERLFARIKDIIAFNPDGICTDYLEEALHL